MSESKGDTLLLFPTVVREVQIANAAKINKQIDAGIEKIRKSEPTRFLKPGAASSTPRSALLGR